MLRAAIISLSAAVAPQAGADEDMDRAWAIFTHLCGEVVASPDLPDEFSPADWATEFEVGSTEDGAIVMGQFDLFDEPGDLPPFVLFGRQASDTGASVCCQLHFGSTDREAVMDLVPFVTSRVEQILPGRYRRIGGTMSHGGDIAPRPMAVVEYHTDGWPPDHILRVMDSPGFSMIFLERNFRSGGDWLPSLR